jgi:hypothetical protein
VIQTEPGWLENATGAVMEFLLQFKAVLAKALESKCFERLGRQPASGSAPLSAGR